MRQLFISIRRFPYQSLATFLILFFSLFLALNLIVALSFLYGILNYVETRPQVIAYFRPKTEEKEIFKIRDEFMASGKVLSIRYVSQEEAFKTYKELNKDNPLLLEMVSPDILPPSLEINAKNPVYLSQIAEFLKKKPGVEEVMFQKNIVDRLLVLTNILKKGAILFFGFLFLMSVVILATLTLFKIALRKKEIELLRLLGAGRFYIEKPFIIEAFFFGLVSSLTSFLVFLSIVFYLKPFLVSYLRGIPKLSVEFASYKLNIWPLNLSFFLIIYLLVSLFGIVLAVTSAFLATEKYLD